jgi:hypothetical protein
MKAETEKNPFKGLLPYEPADSDAYVIDDEVAETFLRKLFEDQFVALVGKPGIGKTSFLNCIFNKKQSEVIKGHEGWSIVHVRPGICPIRNLALSLSWSRLNFGKHDKDRLFAKDKLPNHFVEEATELMISEADGFIELFNKYEVRRDTKIIVVIDPLDDLFMLSEVMQPVGRLTAEEHIATFINLLATFSQRCEELPVYVVVSLSTNFTEKIEQYPKFRHVIERYRFAFGPMDIQKAPDIVNRIMPKECQTSDEYESFRQTIIDDVNESLANKPEWLFFLQHAVHRTVNDWRENKKPLRDCYEDIGGVRDSIDNDTSRIYKRETGAYAARKLRIFDAVLSSVINPKGQFVPRTYGEVKAAASQELQGENSDENAENEIVKPFIHALSEKGIGFFEIVRSADASDRATLLNDESYLATSDAIVIRNDCITSKWYHVQRLAVIKSKQINEYEWYASQALSHKPGAQDYPVTLRSYALSDKSTLTEKDQAEFQIIESLQHTNDAWVRSNIDESRGDLASLEETKKYLKNGIEYWKEKNAAAEKKSSRKLLLRNRIAYVSVIALISLGIVFTARTHTKSKLDKMQSEYDCLAAQYHKAVSFYERMETMKLRTLALQDKVTYAVVLQLQNEVKRLHDEIDMMENTFSKEWYELYDVNLLSFATNHSKYKRQRDEQLVSWDGLMTSQLNSIRGSVVEFPAGRIKTVWPIKDIEYDLNSTVFRLDAETDTVFYCQCIHPDSDSPFSSETP